MTVGGACDSSAGKTELTQAHPGVTDVAHPSPCLRTAPDNSGKNFEVGKWREFAYFPVSSHRKLAKSPLSLEMSTSLCFR